MTSNIFPAERMYPEYPWLVWAIGWLAIFKAILWLAYEPVVPEAVLRVVGWKYILGAVPFLVCGIGLWKRKRWAVWGLIAFAAAELALLMAMPATLLAYLVDSEVFIFSAILSGVMLVCGGPVGDILILCAAFSLFRSTRQA